MNRIHRTVWNPHRGAYMAAAETTRSNGKASGTSGALLAGVLMGMMVTPAAEASPSVNTTSTLPTGAQVTAGQAQIATGSGNTLTVNQGSARAAINWSTFSIGKNSTVNFVQPNSSAVTLNRVTGTEGSVIDGALNANGQVFILNPNGVLFGKGARVDTAGLVATTLGLSDADFMAGKTSFGGNSDAGVTNQGNLTAKDGGYIALLGTQVKNDGVITARLGTVALAAGNKISLNFTGDSLVGVAIDEGVLDALVANGGAVRADGGLVLLTAKGAEGLVNTLVNNTGEVRALTVENREGKIYLLGHGGTVEVAGTLDASAPNGGQGGFIETSGNTLVVRDGAQVSTRSTSGENGTWLIDPTDFSISAGTGTQTASGIGATTLQTALGAGNVTIQTQATGTETGDIYVNAPLAWSANRLTLEAHGDININAVMTLTGTSTLNMKTGYTFNVANPQFNSTKLVRVGMDANGAFIGRVDIDRTGTGILFINGSNYMLINSLGANLSTTTTDLQGMQGDTTRSYALTSNINASDTVNWTDFGNYWNNGFVPVNLTGNFDGLGHVITGLFVDAGHSRVGLFGDTPQASIRNIGLAAANVTGSNDVGALVGYLDGGRVNNSWSTGTVQAGVRGGPGSRVGGLVGNAGAGYITRTWSSSAVTGGLNADLVGGLVGLLGGGLVEYSHASGAVQGYNSYTGGLIGRVDNGAVHDAYATGTVVGNLFTGGLIGELYTASPVQRVYATGAVTGNQTTGGLIGHADTVGIISDAYATGNVTGYSFTAGGLIGEYRSYMSNPATLQDLYATGTVTGTQNVGGLIGFAFEPGPMTRLYATGNVSGVYGPAGGLIGTLTGYTGAGSFSMLSDSYARGNVTGPGGGGGLIGTWSAVDISNTYATGTASNGGLIALVDVYNGGPGTVTNSFWDTQTSGQSSTADGSAVGSTTASMTTTALYTNVGWNFTALTGTWVRKNGLNNNYPFLRTPGYVDTTPLTVTLGGGPLSMVYGGSSPSLSGLSIAGCSACVTVNWGSAIGSTTHAGTYIYASTANIFSLTWANGFNAADYSLTLPTGALTVTPRTVSLASVGGATRVYDGSTAAAASLFSLGNIVNSDSVSLSGSGTLSSKNVGTRTVSLGSLALSNADYTLASVTPSGTVAITAAPLTVTATGGNQVYDGSVIAQITLGSNKASGDVLTLSDTSATLNNKNVGTGKAVSVSGIAIAGTDAGNYTLQNTTASTTTNVTAAPLTVTATGGNQVYDGSVVAQVTLGSNKASGDVLTLSDSGATLNNKNVGTGKAVSVSGIAIAGTDAGNYTLQNTSASTTTNVTAAPLTVTATGGTQVYNAGVVAQVTLGSNKASGDVLTLSNTSATLNDKNAGTGKAVSVNGIAIAGTDAGNYALQNTSASTTTNVTAAPLTVTATGGTQVYDGSLAAQVNLASNKLSGDQLTLNSTATLNNKNVGTGKAVSVSGIAIAGTDAGNYTLQNTSASTTTNVTAAPLTVTATGGNQVYDGSVVAQITLASNKASGDVLTLSDSGATLNNKNVGTGKAVSVSGIAIAGTDAGNYTLQNTSASTTTNVTAAPLTVTATGGTQVYNAGVVAQVTLGSNKASGDVLTLSNTSATLNDKNAGTGKAVSVNGIAIAGTDAGNYTLQNTSASTTTNVTAAPLTVTATGGTQVYDGSLAAQVNLASNKLSGDQLTLNSTATLNNKNVGTGKAVSVSGIAIAGTDAGNYTLQNTSASTTTNVTAAPLTVTATGGNQVYDGSVIAQVTLGSNKASGDVLTLSDSGATLDNKNVGTGKTVSVTGIAMAGTDAANYTLQNTAAFTTTTVTAAPLSVTATGGTQVYDGSLAAQVTLASNKLSGDQLTLNSVATLNDKNVGTGKTVTVSGIAIGGTDAGNYSLQTSTASTTTSVTAAPLTVTASGGTQVYDGSLVAQVVLGSNQVPGDQLTLGGTASLSNRNAATGKAVAVSGIAISGADAGNYTLQNTSTSTTTTVAPAPVTLTVNAGASKVYDGTSNAAAGLLSLAGILTGDSATLGGNATLASRNVGNQTVGVNGLTLDNGNYTLNGVTPTGTVTITARPVSVAAVGGATKVYDGTTSADAGLLQITNVVSGDAVNLAGTATLGGKNVGTQAVNLSGLSLDNGNYTLTGVTPTGTVTITARPVSVAAVGGATKVYDGTTSADAGLLQITNVVSGDAVNLAGTATLGGRNVGTQAVNLTGLSLDNGNYTLTGVTPTGTVTITARPVSVAAVSGATKVYDGTTSADAGLLQITNVVSGDAVNLAGTATLGGRNVGTQAVNLTGLSLDNGNYTLTGVTPTGTVTITARPVSVAAVGGATKVYDGTTSADAGLLQITNVVSGDAVNLAGTATLGGRNVGTQAVNLTGLSLDNGNYTLTGVTPTGTVTITARPVSVAAVGGATKVYDGTTSADAGLLQITNVVSGDAVNLAGTATLGGRNVGTQAVNLTGLSLDNGNYTLTGVTPTGTVTITARPVSVAAVSGATKVYDGTTSADAGLLQITNVVSGDAVNLAGTATLGGKGVGAQTLSLSGLSLNNGNYTLTGATPSGTVTVTPRTLNLSFSVADKVFDGTTAASVTSTDNRLPADQLSVSFNAAYNNADAGSAKPVTITGLTLGGADAANYQVASGAATNATGTLLQRDVSYSLVAKDPAKTYAANGQTLLTPSALDGLVVVSWANTVAGTAPGTLSYTLWKNGQQVDAVKDAGTYEVHASFVATDPHYTIASTGNTVLTLTVTASAGTAVAQTIAEAVRTDVPARTDALASPIVGIGAPVALAQYNPAPPNVVTAFPSLSAAFGEGVALSLISSPTASESSQSVTLNQAKRMMQSQGSQSDTESRDVRVPVSRNSLAEIVNGGVRLPGGVDQLLFVVKADK